MNYLIKWCIVVVIFIDMFVYKVGYIDVLDFCEVYKDRVNDFFDEWRVVDKVRNIFENFFIYFK